MPEPRKGAAGNTLTFRRGTRMSLKDDLAALEAAKPRNFKDWLLTADEEDRELVLSYISKGTIAPNALAVTLTAAGIPITRETIVRLRDDSRG